MKNRRLPRLRVVSAGFFYLRPMRAARAPDLHDSPDFGHPTSLVVLVGVALIVLTILVLLTGWTGWRAYCQPTLKRLVAHGVLLQFWLWVWVIGGPYYHAYWGNWLPALFFTHLLLLVGRIMTAQRARPPRE
jgi:hypothetical protein